MAATVESPATVYSDNLYQMASRSHMSSGSHQGPFVEFVRAHPKGTVRFRPFEDGLDAATRRYIEEFQIYPFGNIEEFCRHIPYASGKKDFLEKTGRESFEVFQYVFKVPGDDKEYHVMWDYNVGLVRMTPFFKCCKYSKTTPAKMLNLNPGLRDITHSITGGSIMAQGYWMPYSCAKAVCATFCYHIAGALIPIFGPDFPSECLPPDSQNFGRMVIESVLVAEATRDMEVMRLAILRGLEDGGASSSYHHGQIPHSAGSSRDMYSQTHVHLRPQSMHYPVLPPLGPPHAHPVSDTDSEFGPQLAPLNYMVSHHADHLLPSPVERETLPPLSHVAALPPNAMASGAIRHGDYEYRRHSISYQRPYYQLPSLRADDSMSHMEDHSRQPRPPVWDSPPAPAPVSPEHPSHWSTKVEDTQSTASRIHSVPRAPASSLAGDHRRAPVDSIPESSDHGRFTSSYCYPSPPCRQHAQLHYPPVTESVTDRRQSPRFAQIAYADASYEVKPALTPRSSKRTTSTAELREHEARHPAQQKLISKRRKLKVSGGGAGPSSSSSAWNALDVDAAEVLVNLCVKRNAADGEDEDEDEKRGGFERPGVSRTKRAMEARNNPRKSAAIASLLCDDSSA